MYTVYILECKDGTFYTGIAKDVRARFAQHREGTGARYTRQHAPRRIVYTEQRPSLSAALKREHQLKGWTRSKKLTLIQK